MIHYCFIHNEEYLYLWAHRNTFADYSLQFRFSMGWFSLSCAQCTVNAPGCELYTTMSHDYFLSMMHCIVSRVTLTHVLPCHSCWTHDVWCLMTMITWIHVKVFGFIVWLEGKDIGTLHRGENDSSLAVNVFEYEHLSHYLPDTLWLNSKALIEVITLRNGTDLQTTCTDARIAQTWSVEWMYMVHNVVHCTYNPSFLLSKLRH